MDIAGSSLVSAVRYRNALAAIEWLCKAFGFYKHRVVSDESGRFLHAHLTFGNAMVTVLPIHDFGLDLHMKQPDEVGGAETQTCYIHVADAVAHHDRAKTEGAEIVLELREDLHGGRGYSCRDPEGHIWSFGTYDPWEGAAPPAAVRTRDVPAPLPSATAARAGVNRLLVLAIVLVCITAAAAAGWILQGNGAESGLKRDMISARRSAEEATRRASLLDGELARERSAKVDAERALGEAEEKLSREREGKAQAESTLLEAGRQLMLERSARVDIDRRASDIAKQFDEERRAKEAAERDAAGARARLGKEQAAKEAALSTSTAKAKELAQERDARQRAERSAKDALEQLARERRAREDAERAADEAQRKLTELATQKAPPPSPRGASPSGARPQEPGAKVAPSVTQPSPMPRVIP